MHITVETILEEIQDKPLQDVLSTVYTCYLSPREKEHYGVCLLHLSGKPQRDLGILLDVHQHKISLYVARLKNKLKRIINTLVYKRKLIVRFLPYLKKHLNAQQYQAVILLLAGNKLNQVAAALKCSPARVSHLFDEIEAKLPRSRFETLQRFIRNLK